MVERLDHLRSQLAVLALLVCGACSRDVPPRVAQHQSDSVREDSLSRARQDSINRTLPGYVVDSILPIDEELRRFRAAVGGVPVNELQGGAASRNSLVSGFVAALASNDSAALRSLALTPREFADLVYPESPYTRPPYRQAPGLVWSQIQNAGMSGFNRLLERLGGAQLRYEGARCSEPPKLQGRNAIWAHCTVRVSEARGPARIRKLFGPIIEREGRFKFVSYATEF